MRQSPWSQHLDFIIHETFLYAVTVFLREQRFEAAALLLSAHYREPERTGLSQRYGIFSHGDTRYLENLLNEMWSKQENGTKYKYPQQRWLHLRASEQLVSFDSLKEADIILWLRYTLERNPDAIFDFLSWVPVTVGSLEDYHWRVDNFPTFKHAASRRFFDQFKVVLGVASKEEFLQRWNRAFPKISERSGDRLGEYWERVFNIGELAST